MQLNVKATNQFLNDLKKAKQRQLPLDKIKEVTNMLKSGEPLPKRCRPHKLIGNWKDCYECHIAPDWLLIYRIENGELHLVRTGRHTDLFR